MKIEIETEGLKEKNWLASKSMKLSGSRNEYE